MKKYLIPFIAFLLSIFTYIACDDNEYADAYNFPFEIELNNSSRGYAGQKVEITSLLTAKYNTTNVTHDYMMVASKDGKIVDSLNNEINTANWIKYKINQKFYYLPNVAGDHVLNFKFKNKFGFQVTNERKITIENSLFSFVSSVSSNSASIGVPKAVKLELVKGEHQPNTTKFKYKFELQNIKGELFKNDTLLSQGDLMSLKQGIHDLKFIPSDTTATTGGKIVFIAQDNFDQSVTTSVALTVGKSSFDFTASSLESQILVDNSSQINFSVTAHDDVPNTTYQMKFQVENQNGSLNGIQQNNWIPIKPGDFNMMYKGLTVGKHRITFEVRNNWNSSEKKTVEIEVKPYTFNFSAVPASTTVYYKQPSNINFNISSNSNADGQTYQLKYEVVKGEGTLQNFEPGVYQNVNAGNFTIPFTPLSNGEVTIKFTAKNNTGYEVEKLVTLTVSVPSFTFTGTFNSNTSYVDVVNELNLNITNNTSIEQTFQVKYEIVEGDAEVEGMQPGILADIKIGDSKIKFKPKKKDKLTIKLTAISNFGMEKSITLTTNVNVPEFSFTATAENATVNLGTKNKISYTIQNNTQVSQTYKLKYSIVAGAAEVEGMTPGVDVELNQATGQLIFTPKTEGVLTIKLEVTNQYNVVKEQTITLNVKTPGFDFTATNASTEANINNPFNVNYTVTNNSGVDQTFEIKYVIESGSADVEGMTPGTYQSLTNLNGTFKITPKTEGDVRIKFTVKSNYGIEKEQTITIKVKTPSFDFTATNASTEANIDNVSNIIYSVANTSGIPQTYQVKYVVEAGSATVEGMTLGNYIDLTSVNGTFKVTPTTQGDVRIKFTVKSSYGVEKDQVITIKVKTPDYSFTASAESPTVNLGTKNNIKYSIQNNTPVNQTYKMKYTIISGSAEVEGMQQGVQIDVKDLIGELKFIPKSEGNISIKLEVANQYGIIKEQTINVTVKLPTFDFTAASTTNDVNVNNPFNVIYSVSNNSGVDQTYEVKYVVEAGSATVEGMQPGQYKSLTNLTNSFIITPTSQGDLKLKFVVKSNFGVEREQTISIKVKTPDFTFTATNTTNDANIDNPFNVNYSVNNGSGVAQTYEVKYVVEAGSAEVEGMQPGVYIPLTNLNGAFKITPKSVAAVKIKFTVKSSYGVEKEQIISINVKSPDYSFTASAESPTVNLGGKNKINYSILNNTPVTQTYKMKYTIVSGMAEVEGMQPGVQIDVKDLNGQLIFTPKTEGVLTIKLEVANQYGIIKEQTINVTVKLPTFDFNATSTITEANINNPFNVNYSVNNGSGVAQTYEIKYVVEAGSAEVEGMQPGVYQSLTNLNSTFNITPKSQGNLRIKFTVKSSYGIEKEQIVNVNVKTPDFTFTASSLSNDANIDNVVSAIYNITNTSSVTQTFQVKYVIEAGTADVEGLTSNTYKDITNLNGAFKITPKSVGAVKIKFTVKSSYGIEKEQTITFNVKTPDYTFSASSDSSTANLNGKTKISYSIQNNSGVPQNYKIKYSIVTGTAEVEGMQPGVQVDVTNLNNQLFITPKVEGILSIKLEVTNQYNVVKEQTITFNVKVPSFEFTVASAVNDVNINNPFNAIYSISNSSGVDQTFEIKYVVEAGSATIRSLQPGVYQSIANLNGTFNINPTSQGNLRIKFTVKSSYGVEKEQIVNVNVKTPDFDFNATNTTTEANINNPFNVNYLVSNTSGVTQTFQVKYVVETGSATIEGMQPGTYQNLSNQNGTFVITPTSQGNLRIKFTVKSSYGVEKEQTITINIKTPSFDFTATSEVNEPNINNPFNVVYTVTNTSGVTQTYQVKYVIEAGTAEVEGMVQGNYINLNNLNGAFKINAKAAGNLRIKFTVKSNYGIEKEQTINVNVKNPDFDFDVVPITSSLYVGYDNEVNASIINKSSVPQNYEIKYVVLQGGADINGMTPGVYNSIPEGTTQIKFRPKLQGALIIQFFVKNNYGIEKTKTLNFEIKNPDFQFKSNILGAQTINLNEFGNIENEIIDDTSIQQDYKLRVATDGQGVFIYGGQEFQNGQEFTITRGISELKYKPTGMDGKTHNIKLTATNSFNISKTTNLSFYVEVFPTLVSANFEVHVETKGGNNKDYRWTYQISYDVKLPPNEKIIKLKFEGMNRHGSYDSREMTVSNPPLKQDRVSIWTEGWYNKPSSKTFDPDKTYTIKVITDKREFTTQATLKEYF